MIINARKASQRSSCEVKIRSPLCSTLPRQTLVDWIRGDLHASVCLAETVKLRPRLGGPSYKVFVVKKVIDIDNSGVDEARSRSVFMFVSFFVRKAKAKEIPRSFSRALTSPVAPKQHNCGSIAVDLTMCASAHHAWRL